jgi:hypothetical protein
MSIFFFNVRIINNLVLDDWISSLILCGCDLAIVVAISMQRLGLLSSVCFHI